MRVLLVSRRFWPHGSLDKAGHPIQLASDLKRRGVLVEVLTPRYAASWAKQFCFREIPVHRPAMAPRSEWSMGRYVRHLTKWMREQAKHVDLILVDGAREEATAAIDAARILNCPVVVRVGIDEQQSDLDWWDDSRSGQRCANAISLADAIICSGATRHRRLISRGFSTQKIFRIDVGFGTASFADQAQRIAARQALAAINRDFHAPPDEPVVFCVCPMESVPKRMDQKKADDGIAVMVQSVQHIVARYPLAHCWFIGDGSRRDSIYDTLRGDGVRSSIAMPGSFGNMDDVFAAADVYVQADEQGLDYFLPAAVSAHLPIVAADLPEVREVLDSDSSKRLHLVDSSVVGTNSDVSRPTKDLIHWYDIGTPKTFRQAIRSVLDDMPHAQQDAATLYRQLVRARPQTTVVDDYENVFQKVIALRRSSNQGPSMGVIS